MGCIEDTYMNYIFILELDFKLVSSFSEICGRADANVKIAGKLRFFTKRQ